MSNQLLAMIQSGVSDLWCIERSALAALLSDELETRLTNVKANDVARREGAVAVIPIHGVLVNRATMLDGYFSTSMDRLRAGLAATLAEPSIKAIVLDINSPGGEAAGIEEMANEIFSRRGGSKPIIAQVNSRAASGGYWLASAADEIVVNPSGEVGSIGALMIHADESKMIESLGMTVTMIASNPEKVEGNPFEPLSEGAKVYIQGKINAIYRKFVNGVAQGRGLSASQVMNLPDGLGKGRMAFAAQAVEVGLADRIGTLQETLARLGAGGIAGKSPRKRVALAHHLLSLRH